MRVPACLLATAMFAAVAATALVHAGDVRAAPPRVTGCGAGAAQWIAQSLPRTAGPFRLETIRCLALPPSPFSVSAPALSQDGARYYAYDGIEGLWVGSVEPDAAPKKSIARLTGSGLGYSETLPFAWATDSRTLLGARQETARPSGFALGPMQPVFVSADGMTHALPALRHRAGPLDGLLWVGANGLAIAEFGTRGGYYRPEHADRAPTLAIVDARRGTVLHAIGMPDTNKRPAARIAAIEAHIDAGGHVVAVFGMTDGGWYLWRQGEAPHVLPFHLPGAAPRRVAISPDSSSLLAMRGLSAVGLICEHNPKCPPPTPRSGTIAELRDLATGQVRWRISGTATAFSSDLTPAISPDGRLALVSLPRNGAELGTIALVAMQDGRVVQRLRRADSSGTALAFGPGGDTIRVSGGSTVAIYRRASTSRASALSR